MPTPPACWTARLLLTRALVPRSQTTIFPATFAGSSTACPPLSTSAKHSRSAVAFAPVRPAAVELINGLEPTALANEAPWYVTPVPRVAAPRPSRLCVPAATVVTHGLGCATVPLVGPLLPADADTKTPASAAFRKAISAASRKFVEVPLIE